MKLTSEQEDTIKTFVDSQGIKTPTLRDDLVDHLCCVIEYELGKRKGESFQKLLDKATVELAPNGLSEIQNQTLFLLNSKRIIIMKKLMYIIGLIGSISLTAGVTFKLLGMPYGTVLFTIGFLTLLLVFVPLFALDRYKVAISKAASVRLRIILGLVAAVITGLSGLFKVLHLQGADILLMLGAIIFAFGFLPFFFFTMYKKSVV